MTPKTTTQAEEFMPGIYPNIPEAAYHSCQFGPPGSLSAHEAKNLLDCPAIYRHMKDNPSEVKAAFDFGHVVHELILGTGAGFVVHDFDSLRTKAAREFVAEVREAGKTPISRADYDKAMAAAQAVKSDPIAAALFAKGEAEQSIYAKDEETGVWMRGRVDWITQYEGRPVLVDVKTTRDPNPYTFNKQAANLDYGLQAAWYQTLYTNVTGVCPRFVHVLVGVDAPHIVSVVEMDDAFIDAAVIRMSFALGRYRECRLFDSWPAYSSKIVKISPPAWYQASPYDPTLD